MLTIKTETKYHLVFSHDDADGILAAFAIKWEYDNSLFNKDWPRNVNCILCDYSKEYNLNFFKKKTNEWLDELKEDEVTPKDLVVYMTDYAIQPNEDMMKFYNYITRVLGAEFIWIDHHSSAIENLIHFKLPGIQDVNYSGCMNTWKFVHKTSEVPMIYKLINEFDLWHRESKEFSWDAQIAPCSLILQSFLPTLNDNTSPIVQFLHKVLSEEETLQTTLSTIGKSLYDFIENVNMKHSSKVYEATFMDKYSCLALNTIDKGSRVFELCTTKSCDSVDLLVTWTFNGEMYEYNIYTTKDDIDVGRLCEESLNGGGHPKAGGGKSLENLVKKI